MHQRVEIDDPCVGERDAKDIAGAVVEHGQSALNIDPLSGMRHARAHSKTTRVVQCLSEALSTEPPRRAPIFRKTDDGLAVPHPIRQAVRCSDRLGRDPRPERFSVRPTGTSPVSCPRSGSSGCQKRVREA